MAADGYAVEDREVVFRSHFTTMRTDRVRMPDGSVGEREIAEHPSAVGAVVVDDEGRVVLLRQYRHAFETHFLELPAGKLDQDGEDRAEAMQRELAEEVALHAGRLEPLTTYTNSAGWTTETTTVFLATDLTEVERPEGFELEHEEAEMEVLRMPLAEAVDLVRRGEVVDSKTVIGLLLAADRLGVTHA